MLADALQLPVTERILLRRLVKEAGHDAVFCTSVVEPTRTVRPSVRAMLDRLEPTPAVLLNWIGDILAYTSGYRRFAGPLGVLDGKQPNILRYVFTDERARAAYSNWDQVADVQVAHLRHEASLQDPHVAAVADELTVTAGAPFADRLAAVPAMPRRAGTDLVAHPEAAHCACRTKRSPCRTTATVWSYTCPPMKPQRPRWTASTGGSPGRCGRSAADCAVTGRRVQRRTAVRLPRGSR